ncbi:hypothetical protein SAPIO_CDS6132 [Scedosporium apiospermum]|uniref:Cytochrome P450 n=1 Tax=Pseudallescheria apiosperma TaxID=563466 RepID=A0A084G4L1_PSEDA|nr:uncharacterized protein SAPIO_CDS6132 [Scedosporium apiospermum]KEZ42273.1 hypothetical protein SAPIO_CDS6132 [Scedosporium apiospermum]
MGNIGSGTRDQIFIDAFSVSPMGKSTREPTRFGRSRPIVRIAPNEYSIDDPAAAKVIYGSGRGFVKSPWYQASGSPYSTVTNIFTEPDPHLHATARRKIAAAYSMTSLVQLERFVDECTAVLRTRLEEFAESGASVDISHWMQCYAFDVIGKITMGSKKLSGLQNVRNFATTWVEAKVARFQSEKDWTSPNATTDIITRLLRGHDNDPGKISKAEILTAGIMNVGAGSDTTSIAFSAAIFNLLKHPSSLRQLQEEIREYEARGIISDPIKFSEAQKMPYLQAVIKEALRAVVGINSWVAHANQEVFGPDANAFRPERWLEEPEVVKKRESYFMAFGQGSRTCIGKNISLMELSKVIPQIVRHFNLTPDTDSNKPEWRIENVWFVKTRDFYCKVSKIS